jgi:hypothetical protein
MTRDDGSAAKLRQGRHPEKSILLAYIRRQPLDDRLYIQQHIEHCERCSQLCDEYKLISGTLEDALMRASHFYPQLTSRVIYSVEKHLYESGKLRAAQRQGSRGYRSGRRMAGLPVAISLVLLFAVLLTTVAYAISTNHTPLISNISHQGIVTTQPTPDLGNLVPPPQVTSKHKHPPKHAVAPTRTSSVAAATTPFSTPQPSMVICGRSATGTAMYLMLCGYHFTPGDKVTVVLEYPENNRSLAPITVNANGQFEDSVSIACAYVPIAIYAKDQTHSKESGMLTNIPRGCTPVPGTSS